MTEPTKPPDNSRWGKRIVLVLMAAIAIPLGVTLVYTYSPTTAVYFPRCYFNLLTGLHCPGCGATRCVVALGHGDLAQAFAYNPLLILLTPLLAYGAWHMAFEMWTGRRPNVRRLPAWVMRLLVVVVIAFWIARNINIYPLDLLVPHVLE